MKNSKRKSSRIALVMLLLMCMALFMSACGAPASSEGGGTSYNMKVTDATSDFYVNDFAGLFTADQKETMMNKAINLDKDYDGIQVVVTTVDSLDGCVKEKSTFQSVNVETVAYSMFLQYGIGQDDMGILVLFSTGDREVRIETGKKMQTYITDGKSGQILDDYGMDYFRNDQFAEGLVAVQDAVISEIKAVVPQDWNPNPVKAEEVTRGEVVAPTEPAVYDKPATETTNPVKDQATIVTTENNTELEKSEGTGGMIMWIIVTIFAILISILITAAVVSSKLSIVRNQLDESEKELSNQKKKYEGQIGALNAQHAEEMESQRRQMGLQQERVLKMQSDASEQRIKELRELSESKDQQITKKNKELFDKSKKIIELEKQLAVLQDKFTRAQKLHPDSDFELEVEQMIQGEFKQEAERIDGKIAECIDLPADKDRVDVLSKAIYSYDSTTPEVARYLTSDRTKLQKLLDDSNRLKSQYEKEQQKKRDRASAQRAYDDIKSMVTGITMKDTAESYRILSRAIERYNRLSPTEKQYFPDMELLRRLENTFKTVKSDYDNQNKAKSAESEVQRILGYMSSADENDREKLERAMRQYRNLSQAQTVYFSAELLRKLKRLIEEAEADHRRQEERRRREAEERRRREEEARRRREEEERRRRREAEERRRREDEERRRRMMSSSSHSSFGGSSFGGHGGRPSGGGASRRF